MASKKKAADQAVVDAPVLKTDDALFSTPADAVPEVSSSAAQHLKLPTFWPDAAEVWFAQTDAQFAIRNISSSKTKFYHAVAVLPQEVASQILDLIRAPPLGDPYKVLRDCLVRFNPTLARRVQPHPCSISSTPPLLVSSTPPLLESSTPPLLE